MTEKLRYHRGFKNESGNVTYNVFVSIAFRHIEQAHQSHRIVVPGQLAARRKMSSRPGVL